MKNVSKITALLMTVLVIFNIHGVTENQATSEAADAASVPSKIKTGTKAIFAGAFAYAALRLGGRTYRNVESLLVRPLSKRFPGFRNYLEDLMFGNEMKLEAKLAEYCNNHKPYILGELSSSVDSTTLKYVRNTVKYGAPSLLTGYGAFKLGTNALTDYNKRVIALDKNQAQ